MRRDLLLGLASAFTITPVAAYSQGGAPIAGQPPGGSPVLIPAEYYGVWDADLKACEADASDVRSYIGGNRIRFPDSVGEVREIIQRGDRSVTMMVSFRRDADPWEDKVQLSLSPSGNELTVRFTGGSFTRHRCPEEPGDR